MSEQEFRTHTETYEYVWEAGDTENNVGEITSSNSSDETTTTSVLNTTNEEVVAETLSNSEEAQIINSGVIQAVQAEIKATGGNIYSLAVNNTGIIEATGAEKRNGVVYLTADSGQIKHTGSITAKSSIGNGGSISIQSGSTGASSASVSLDGDIKASGNSGGNIDIQSDWVALGGNIQADGLSSGGNIKVQASGLSLAEHISAKGGSAQGGVIDIKANGKITEISSSTIDASGAEGGRIKVIADQQITTSGNYKAVGTDGDGGDIAISAAATKLLSAQIDASGTEAGGRIQVGGDFQGGKENIEPSIASKLPEKWKDKSATENPLLNAQTLAVTSGTLLNASGNNGDGGLVVAWSDQKTAFYGKVDVTPGEKNGAGGFAEVSSKGDLSFFADVKTGVGDRKGELLLDPKNLIVGNQALIPAAKIVLGYNYTDIQELSGGSLVKRNNGLEEGMHNGDHFGHSVAVDDKYLIVGAPGFDTHIPQVGAVYQFEFGSNDDISLKRMFKGTDGNHGGGYTSLGGRTTGKWVGNISGVSGVYELGEAFGYSVDISNGRIYVGSPYNDVTLYWDSNNNPMYNFGAVFVYDAETGQQTASFGKGLGGSSVDISSLAHHSYFGSTLTADNNLFLANNKFFKGTSYLGDIGFSESANIALNLSALGFNSYSNVVLGDNRLLIKGQKDSGSFLGLIKLVNGNLP